MNDNFEAYAVAVIVVFGAITVGGLMAAAIAFDQRDGFFFALGGSTAAWLAGYALFLDRPRAFIAALGISVLMAIAAAVTLIP